MPKQRNLRYIEIANQLKTELSSHVQYEFPIQSERKLAERFHVSRNTVRMALNILYKEHLISKKMRSGSFPLPPIINRDLQAVYSISEDLDPLNISYNINIINVSEVKELPPKFTSISNEKNFHKVERSILIAGIPTIYEEHFLPISIFPNFPKKIASNIFSFVEEMHHLIIKDSYQNISLQNAPLNVQNILEIDSPMLLHISSHSCLNDDRIFQFTTQFFHPNYNFKIHLKR